MTFLHLAWLVDDSCRLDNEWSKGTSFVMHLSQFCCSSLIRQIVQISCQVLFPTLSFVVNEFASCDGFALGCSLANFLFSANHLSFFVVTSMSLLRDNQFDAQTALSAAPHPLLRLRCICCIGIVLGCMSSAFPLWCTDFAFNSKGVAFSSVGVLLRLHRAPWRMCSFEVLVFG